jgi:cytochrome c oxidase subunit 1
MLFCIGFVSNFIIGGVTGVFLASIPVNLVLHDTYYVVGHFHYIVMGAIAFAVFAGIYYWYPIFTGKMYQRKLGKWHFWLSMIGTNVTFFAMLVLGYLGMTRRYATYELTVASAPIDLITLFHRFASVGALILFIGQLIFLWNFVSSWLDAPEVEDGDPWNLEQYDMRDKEFKWHEDRITTAVTDGGEEELAADGGEEELAADGGEEVATDGGDVTGEPTDASGTDA